MTNFGSLSFDFHECFSYQKSQNQPTNAPITPTKTQQRPHLLTFLQTCYSYTKIITNFANLQNHSK